MKRFSVAMLWLAVAISGLSFAATTDDDRASDAKKNLAERQSQRNKELAKPSGLTNADVAALRSEISRLKREIDRLMNELVTTKVALRDAKKKLEVPPAATDEHILSKSVGLNRAEFDKTMLARKYTLKTISSDIDGTVVVWGSETSSGIFLKAFELVYRDDKVISIRKVKTKVEFQEATGGRISGQ